MKAFVRFLISVTLLGAAPVDAQSTGVLREVYTGIPGVAVADLTGHASFPDSPASESVQPTFEAPTDVLDNYGQRMRALLTAPTTGNYVFWISSDDASQLFLSTDGTPPNKRLIARVDGWTPSRRYNVEPNQRSASIALMAGQDYYIEALMKEGGGGDNLAVTWQRPGDPIPSNGAPPISGSYLTPFGLGPPVITTQPASQSVVEGASATFTVRLERSLGATYQWLRNGANIPGAITSSYTLTTTQLSDSGSTFGCFVSNGYGTTNSATATLTVLADTTPPTIAAVVNYGNRQRLTVRFSEPVEPASATQPSNYSIDGGVSVLDAGFADDPRTIVLTTGPLSVGPTYTLTVNGVRDRAANPNPIASSTQRAFTLTTTPLDIGVITGASEPLGPSTRRTGLIFSEIMYHPTNRVDDRELEFIELYNSESWPADISGYRISGEIDYTFPTGTTIGARAFLVVAPVPADIQAVHGISNVTGGFGNRLNNAGGAVRLRNRSDAVLLEVNYSPDPPWPVSADGAGHSLVLARPSYGEGDLRAWAPSDVAGGSPGTGESVRANPHRTVLINELLVHTDEPDLDYVELFNYSAQSVDVGGCVLTDDPETNKFVIPAGTTIQPRGLLVYNQNELGFALSTAGETLYLLNAANRTKVIDVVRFRAQENGVSIGRYPDGAPNLQPLQAQTPGEPNAQMRLADLVINEIMYHPISGDNDDQYIELHNRGSSPIALGNHRNLAAWHLRGGISFNFPPNATIAPGGYVVVAKNVARLLASHPDLDPGLVFGDFSGTLSRAGDRITLTIPEDLIETNGPAVTTNIVRIVMDEVTYGDDGRWDPWADGGGSSLELVDPHSDNRLPSNWAASDETAKAPWTLIETTGVLDNGNGAIDELQLFLQGAGECLVDNLEVIPQGGANRIANGGYESGLTGWVPQGNHDQSGLASMGYSSAHSLHVRALGRGDHGANRIRTPLTSSLSPGSTATIRARARWLRGHPELLLRLHGNHLEAIGALAPPTAPGTPGAPNSRRVDNAGPVIFDVSHSPVLPAANQTVTVRAQVNDPDGLANLVVYYRVDPATNFTSVAMNYNGAGFYSANLPGQTGGSAIAFHIQAADAASPSAVTRFPADAPAREGVIRFGEPTPAGTFPTYRLWLTQRVVDRWSARLPLDNGDLDATFVAGNHRVIYNLGTLYSGSPWIAPGYSSPVGNLCGYVLHFPKDDRFLGATDFVLDWPIRDGTGLLEQIANWMADQLDLPFDHRRSINLYVNGLRRGTIYEDAQQPNSDVIDQWWPDDNDGDLFKIDDWFEFDDNANREFNVDATLQDFTTTGGEKKLARYRWNWRKRATDAPNDYASLFALVDALNAPADEYTRRVEELVDVEQWMRIFAIEHIVGNWDSYGYNRGKNMYTYKPRNGKWAMLMWDIDFLFDAGGDGPTTSMYAVNDAVIARMYNHPPFRRAYLRAMQDAVNGPLLSTRVNPVIDARYNAFVASGLGVSNPDSSKTWIQQRRSYLLTTELNPVATGFTVNGGSSFDTNRNLIAITGSAPIAIKTIEINGIAYPVTWTSVTGWTLRVALSPGANTLVINGYDLRGNPVAGATATLTVNYTGGTELPQDKLVINELMYHPPNPDAEFVEIHNTSTANAFDLSNWRIQGVDGTIPEGTIAEPNAFLVFVRDRAAFMATYGTAIPIAGEYPGRLDNDGETIRLLEPDPGADVYATVDQVTYGPAAPWSAAAAGGGSSLQLIDPLQDNERVANWAAAAPLIQTNDPPQTLIPITHTWRYNQTANLDDIHWQAIGYNDASWPSGPALLYNETASLPAPKNTPLTLGRMTYYFRTHFNFTGEPGSVGLRLAAVLDDGAVFYLNGVEVLRLGVETGEVSYTSPANRTVGDAAFEGSFLIPAEALLQGDNVFAVEVHQVNATSSDIVFGMTLDTDPTAAGLTQYTPGAANSVRGTLAAFPLVWLNEVLPNNINGITDRFGQRHPWVELYNGGAGSLDLAGYYLANNYTNLAQWAFPENTVIGARQFLTVWLDGNPGNSIPTELHASFTLPSTTGSVALAKSPTPGANPVILDYMNYNVPSAGRSYGDFPDGNVSARQQFTIVTPGATNNPAGAPINVFFNEWMADNRSTLLNLATGDYSDWFELYNPGSDTVDLSGYYLTDSPTDTTKWRIPQGATIQPGGYLLVWADAADEPYSPGDDLHADFQLDADGEMIGLFGDGGVLIDALTFGPQTTDVSEGRFPDGGSSIQPLTAPTPGAPNTLIQSNLPPVLEPIGDKIVDQDGLLTFTAQASDPNPGQSLIYTLEPPIPSGAAIDPVTAVFSWVPAAAQAPGVYSLTIQVSDDGEPPLTGSQTFSVTVRKLNQPPTLQPVADRSIAEGSLLVITNVASDLDLPAQTLTFSLDPVPPPGMTLDPVTGVLRWTPSEAQGPGTFFVTVRVADDGDPPRSVSQTFSLFVTELNTAPVLDPIPNRTSQAGNTLAFRPRAADPDIPANALTFTLEPGAPAGASIDPATGEFSWTPTAVQAQVEYTLIVRVTDDGAPPLSDTASFMVMVTAGLRISAIEVTAQTLTLAWDTVPGRSYQLQQTTDLTSGPWTLLGAGVQATGTTLEQSVTVEFGSRQFYRVVQTD